MKWPPTDLEILEEIYRRYYTNFSKHSEEMKLRAGKIYVPIDIQNLADHFSMDADIIFGRLYYHLEFKHGYTRPDGTKVPFFDLAVGGDRHVVHFPLLAAVVADLREGKKKHLTATWISIAALIVSLLSILISVARTSSVPVMHVGECWNVGLHRSVSTFERQSLGVDDNAPHPTSRDPPAPEFRAGRQA
jgi:hypothetical protein